MDGQVRVDVEEARALCIAAYRRHGVPAEDGATLHRTALDFFDLPLDEKLAVRRPKNDQNRGYIPYGEETLVRMSGGDSPPDVKEVFAIGPDATILGRIGGGVLWKRILLRKQGAEQGGKRKRSGGKTVSRR